MARTTYDIQRESLTVEWQNPATEKDRTISNLKTEIAAIERELAQLRIRLEELERE